MKLGVISDIHSNVVALETVLRRLDEENIENIVCAGDLVGYYPFPDDTVSRIRNLDIDCVMGNHDYALVNETPENFNRLAKRAIDWSRRNISEENRIYLNNLPHKRTITVDNVDIYLTHGSPEFPLEEYIWESDIDEDFLHFYFENRERPDIVILGHTHRPYVKYVNGTLCLNPGSVGQPRDGDPRASFAILDTKSRDAKIQRIDYEIDWVAEETMKHLPRELADRLYEGK